MAADAGAEVTVIDSGLDEPDAEGSATGFAESPAVASAGPAVSAAIMTTGVAIMAARRMADVLRSARFSMLTVHFRGQAMSYGP